MRAVPTPLTFDALGKAYDRRAAIIRTEIDSLSKLDPPDELQVLLKRLVAAIQDELAAAEDLRIAGLSSDIEGAQGAVYRGRNAARRAGVVARRLGLRVCGRSSRTR